MDRLKQLDNLLVQQEVDQHVTHMCHQRRTWDEESIVYSRYYLCTEQR